MSVMINDDKNAHIHPTLEINRAPKIKCTLNRITIRILEKCCYFHKMAERLIKSRVSEERRF
jgi:hypothetical protein